MGLFRDDHKGHMIYTHASGPDSGPWVGLYTVWALNGNTDPTSVLHGSAEGSYSSIKFACAVARNEAERRIDVLLLQHECRAAAVLRKPYEPYTRFA
jgi:hypothetical protein